jgi:hypothetical protein
MSVSSTISSVTYSGNASTSAAYPVTFQFFDATDLTVYVVNSAGLSTTLALGTGYTVSGGAGSTGNVLTTSAIPSTSRVTIARNTSKTQTISYTTGDRFPASTHERALDKLTLIAQENNRSSLPDTAATSGLAPYVLGLSATGSSPSWVPQSSSGIADGAITTAKIADNSITSAKIANGAILPADLSTGGPTWDVYGNLGIGTSSPARKLQVSINAAPASSQSAKTGLVVQNTDSSGTTGAPNSAAIQFAFDPASPRGYIESGTYGLDFLGFGIAGTERLRIDTSGNVGIGTSSPTTKLDVIGEISASTLTTKGAFYPMIQLQNTEAPTDKKYFRAAVSTVGVVEIGRVNDAYTAGTTVISIDASNTISVNGNPIVSCPTTAKAWVTFIPSTGVIPTNGNYNVSSISRSGIGKYAVNYTSAAGAESVVQIYPASSSTGFYTSRNQFATSSSVSFWI